MAFNARQIETAVSIAREYGVTRLILFGSAAEKPEEARDLDIACDGVPGWRLFEMGGRIENEINAVVDILPLSPPTAFTRMIERRGRVLI